MLETVLFLGLIPWTNIEIGFYVWLFIFAIIAYFVLKYVIGYYRDIRNARLMLDVRQSVHAKSLHSRLR